MENPQLIIDWANRDLPTIFFGFASGIITFLIGRWLARLLARYASRSMERAHLDPMAVSFAKNLVFFGVMGAVVVAALNEVGIHTTSLTALLASAGVAIGLATKDSLANLASGLMILIFRPYSINNFVEASGTKGLVEEVQIFNTILRTPDNVKVIVPNSAMVSGNIKNYSAFETRRIDLVVSISYDDSIGAARDLLMALMTAHPLVLSTPAPTVEVLDLAESSVTLAVRPWVLTVDYWPVRSDLLEQMKLRLTEAGLSIPYPQQVIYLHQPATLSDGEALKQTVRHNLDKRIDNPPSIITAEGVS